MAIVGADGAGKSTVVEAATRSLRAKGYAARPVDRWDIVDNPNFPAARFMKADIRDIRSCVADMPNPARLLFLVWLVSMAMSPDCVARAQEDLLLIDGYWMKHVAGEIAYGLDEEWTHNLVAALPVPDLVIYLQLSPEQAWSRKRDSLVPYECGMDASCPESGFLAHQRHIHDFLDSWRDRYGWTTVDASGLLTDVVDSVVERICEAHSRPSVRMLET